MGCHLGKEKRKHNYKETPPVNVEAVSERSEIGKVYKDMAKDPEGFFLKRDNKRCFLKNASPRKEAQPLALFQSLQFLEQLGPQSPPLKG